MNALRRTKIVATLGPASAAPAVVSGLVEAGVDVFRLNFSHGDHDEHAGRATAARAAAAEQGRTAGLLQDLQGPKIRVGSLSGGSVELAEGARLTITSRPVVGTADLVSTTYGGLPGDVRPGQRILLDDGLLELRVVRAVADEVECEVVRGGLLGEHKGINLPGTAIRAPALSDKDAADLRFGLRLGVDMVALSFVRSERDADPVRAVMRGVGRNVPLLAKIEKPEAVNAIAAILRRFDGVMLARGDLGVEMAPEFVPGIQKQVIAAANEMGKPVITATQMLESMTHNPRPTRAEASDVANAVVDGTDAVMLSGETAIGRYPAQTVQTMDRIVREAEAIPSPAVGHARARSSRAHAVCHSAVALAGEVRAAALAAFTRSGRTVQILSKLRPAVPIFAFCDQEAMGRRLALWRGVVPLAMRIGAHTDQTTQMIATVLRARGLVEAGADVVVVGASGAGGGRRANLIRLLRI